MTTINPVEPTANQGIAFKKSKKIIKQMLPKFKKLTEEQANMEQIAGSVCAANTKDAAVLKKIIMRETMLGHMDFVKGINDYLAKNASKNAYKK